MGIEIKLRNWYLNRVWRREEHHGWNSEYVLYKPHPNYTIDDAAHSATYMTSFFNKPVLLKFNSVILIVKDNMTAKDVADEYYRVHREVIKRWHFGYY